ncbi:MAG TPA: hypothetical protein PLT30_14020 [Deltaproteobacteria bacterium]|jgi:hypothetical protein|nr:hypothetical protein [Deltaproteobacteria bacterium]
MKTIKGLLVVLTVAMMGILPVSASAQGPMGDEEALQMMAPVMGEMFSQMIRSMFTELAKRENADMLATFTRNYYESLVAKGFSKEEALRIVVSTGMPTAPMMK